MNPGGIPGCHEVELVRHEDHRGTIVEVFNASSSGQSFNPKQINVTKSFKSVLRGFHFSLITGGQQKLVFCSSGVIIDACLDIRVGSPTFGSIFATELSDANSKGLFIDAGLAHAFYVLSETATVTYLLSNPYDGEKERTINATDTALAVPWPTDRIVMSERDRNAPHLSAYDSHELPKYGAT